MDAKKHNGWYSVETSLVALWIDNEQATYDYWRAVADETLKLTDQVPARLEEATATLSDRLRDEICDAVPPENKGLFADLLSHALTQVDWQEIADHLLADAVLKLREETERDIWTGPRPEKDAEPQFPLGQIVSTPGALESINPIEIMTAIARHHRGDWGDCCPEDWESNVEGLREGFRLFSVYRSGRGERFWIITEADRSVTTVLLPSEY